MINNRTHIELSSGAFDYNIDQIKKSIGAPDVAVVVKSNAYGHGMVEIANLCEKNPQVKWLCTAGLAEAITLRSANISKPILVLSYLDTEFELAALYNIHCAIYTFEDAQRLDKTAKKLGKIISVHVKIDTGMSRLGISPEAAIDFIRQLKNFSNLIVIGIFTHLCDTPNPDQSFSYLQLDRFDNLLDKLHSEGIDIPITHAQSSSGLCIIPKRQYSFVRIGASAYGIWKSESHKQLVLKVHPELNLEQVLTWKTNIIQIKDIAAGSFVGYDKTFCASRDTRIAVLPVGYYDGLPRGLSNKGQVLVCGKLAPILGIVSMNLMAIDITDIVTATLHSEVILLGPQAGVQAMQVAQAAGIITNELITHINSNLQKIVSDYAAHTFDSPIRDLLSSGR